VKTDLSSTVDTVIYIYYGETTATDSQDVEGVWDSDYMGVWHLEETATDETTSTGLHLDSTSNNNNGDQNENTNVAGKIGSNLTTVPTIAQDFDGGVPGGHDYIQISDSASLDVPQAFTISAWIRDTGNNGANWPRAVSKGNINNATGGYSLVFDSVGTPTYRSGFRFYDGTAQWTASSNMSNVQNSWRYLVGTYDNAADTFLYYLDGELRRTTAIGGDVTVNANAIDLTLGTAFDGTSTSVRAMDGWIDEVRISDIARNIDWINASYSNQDDPSSFYSVGAEEETHVIINSFSAFAEKGRVLVEWQTALEVNTAGFRLLRMNQDGDKFFQIHDKVLPGLIFSPQGGTYQFVDPTAQSGKTYTYKLVEVESSGYERHYGPFTVDVKEDTKKRTQLGTSSQAAGKMQAYTRFPHETSAAHKNRLAERKAELEILEDLYYMRKRVGVAKIATTDSGIYFVSDTEIADALGISIKKVQRYIDRGRLNMMNRGQRIAYGANEDNTGIYFYGEHVNSLYANENVYWLKMGRGLTMESSSAGSPASVSSDQNFRETLYFDEDHYMTFYLGLGTNYWFMDGIIAGDATHESKTFTLRSDGLASTTSLASLTLNLQGAVQDFETDLDHHVIVELNGTQIGEAQWEGISPYTLVCEFDQSILTEGDATNSVVVHGILDSGVQTSIFYVDTLELSYQRLYTAVDDKVVVRGDGNSIVTVNGFTNADIVVCDISNPQIPRYLVDTTIEDNAGLYQVSFIPEAPEIDYTVYSTMSPLSTSYVRVDTPTDLKSHRNSADYVIITPTELLAQAATLAVHRASQGYESLVVNLEDIYDEFNHGISNPSAIKDFIAYAYDVWALSPQYIVLAGDGTYDYRNIYGHNDNLVPTLMVSTPSGPAASDIAFITANNGNLLPIAVGRLPVLTTVEFQNMIDKMIAYENESKDSWSSNIVMLSDNADSGGNFPSDSAELTTYITPTYTFESISLADTPVGTARQQAIDEINSGALLVNYVGHGAFLKLATEGLLRSSDIDSLSNGAKAPVMSLLTCAVGNFAQPGYEIFAETYLLKSDAGALALWSPSGQSDNDEARDLNKAFFTKVFQDNETCLGDAIIHALLDQSGTEKYMLNIYNLLGDPAMQLK